MYRIVAVALFMAVSPAIAGDADLAPIYFDTDNDAPQFESQGTIIENVHALRDNLDLGVVIYGNCDERGGHGYNLDLGQRRAEAVQNHYISMGIDKNRIAVLSWGKEMPVCEDHTEDCWQANRRADTLVRVIR